MRNKIGILTWHYYPNFGSALQAYALHTYINNHGCDAVIINYVVGKRPALWRIRLFLSRLDAFIPNKLSSKIHYRFLAFEQKYFKETPIVRTREELMETSEAFDVIVCGSDQIWAPNVLNENYLLSFVPDNKKKVSYAASIGLPTIPVKDRALYKRLLSRFYAISVREQQGKKILENELDIRSEVVLDPTLLIQKEEWRSLARRKTSRKYVLCYFLGKNIRHREIVREIAASAACDVICLSRFQEDKAWGFEVDDDAGPLEFIGYVDNALYVVTDSFHGLCFSVNLEKNFYVLNRFEDSDPINQNSRISNLLSFLGLDSRLISDVPDLSKCIDYQSVKRCLDIGRKNAHAFLQTTIGIE